MKKLFFEAPFSKKGILIFFALLFFGMYQMPIKLMGTDFQNIPGDMADGRLNNYFLEHGYLFFTGKTPNYWNAPFMYPEKNVITYSDNLLGTLPIYAAFRVSGCDRESAYQGWMVVLFALNFIFAAYALCKISGNLAIGSIGAYIFAFSMPIAAQMNHAQVFPRFMIPLVFMWLILFFKNPKNIFFAGIVLGIVFQFYAGIYLGFLLAFCVFVCALAFLFYVKNGFSFVREMGRKKIIQLLGISVFALILLLPLLYPYYERSKLSGVRTYEEVVNSIPYIKSYFFAWQGSICWSFLTSAAVKVPIWWDHYLFPGGIAMICLFLFPFIAYKKKWNFFTKEVVGIFISIVVIVLLTIQSRGFSLYKIVYHLPGFSSMRAVGRIINVELFLFSLIVVFILCWAEKKVKHKNGFILLIAVACMFDQYSPKTMCAYSKKDSQQRILIIENQLKAKNYTHYSAFAYIPDDKNLNTGFVQLDGMMVSQALNIPTVNGYTATCPGEFGPFWRDFDSTALHNWLASRDMDIVKNKILLIK